METLLKCLHFTNLIAGLSQYDKRFIPNFEKVLMKSLRARDEPLMAERLGRGGTERRSHLEP